MRWSSSTSVLMRVFSDYHHNGLFHSLVRMGRRVGFELYRPIGLEWNEEGFFGNADPYAYDPAIKAGVVKQYLEPTVNTRQINGTAALNDTLSIKEGVYTFEDIPNLDITYGITLEAFKRERFDAIIASIPQHLTRYRELRDRYQPQAKLIYQVGNPNQPIAPLEFANILDSVGDYPDVHNTNYIQYHQEFDENIFFPCVPYHHTRQITSLVLSPERMDIMDETASLLPEYKFTTFGYQPPCSDWVLTGVNKIAYAMQASRFGWHYKTIDGYGHIIHNWFACMRPVICNYSGYTNKIARPLMIDGVTGFDIDGKTPKELAECIKRLENVKDYQEMCINVRLQYGAVVNFNREGEKLKTFFAHLR